MASPARASHGNLPFEEAIRYFRGKVNLPTDRWTDLVGAAHARAFAVAGANRDEILTDFRAAVDKAIAEGTTLEDFRKDFDGIVARHGWSYRGSRGWRTGVILRTNVRTAYQAGRHAQMTDPDLLAARPYWRYRHGDSENPRPAHLAWDGLVLEADDPWWRTHFPPNGWGCSCSAEPLSPRELEALGKSGPDTPPRVRAYAWKDPAGRTHRVPRGIDPGWDYNVGEAAWGRPLAEEAMNTWRAQGARAWERLTPGDWRSAGRPERLAAEPAQATLGATAADVEAAQSALERLLGGEEKVYRAPGGLPVLVNAHTLAGHLELNRSAFIPLLPELIEQPQEIWLSFERHKGTGRVELRQRLLRVVQTDRARAVLLVAQAVKGRLEAWTFLPTDRWAYVQRQRVGKLLWSR